MIQCSNCGTESRVGVQFCSNCGAALQASPPPPVPGRISPTAGVRTSSLIIAALCVLYLLNPTLGVFELIPDNLPLIGNLDKAGAMTGLLLALNSLGLINFKLRP